MADDAADAGMQLLEMKQQNLELQQALAARELEVKALKEIAAVQDQESPAAKVIELSKKNRDLNLKLERERTKVAKLEQSLAEATAGKDGHVAQKVQAAARSVVEEAAGAADAAAREAAALKERAQHQNNRIGQLEQKVFLIEAENKKLKMVLQREVGEEVPLAKLLEEGSDWKGRREIIVALKDQLRQAKEQVAGKEALTKAESSHKQSIIKLNKGRTAEADRTAAELAAAKAEMDKLRLAYHGSMSRRKVLETEVASLREKMAVVLAKTRNDDKLIETLRKELALATKGGGKVDMSAKGSGYAELVELRERCVMQEEQIDQQQKIIFYLQGKSPQPTTIFASPSMSGAAFATSLNAAGFGAGISAAVNSSGGAYTSSPDSRGMDGSISSGGGGGGGGLGYGPGSGSFAQPMDEFAVETLRDENEELKARVAALTDDLQAMSRPGTSSDMSAALREQVLALQEDIDRLQAQVGSKAPSKPPSRTASVAGSKVVSRVASKVGSAVGTPARSARPSVLGGGGSSKSLRSARVSGEAVGAGAPAAAPFVYDADGAPQADAEAEAEGYEEGVAEGDDAEYADGEAAGEGEMVEEVEQQTAVV